MAERKKKLPRPHKGRNLKIHDKIEIANAVCEMYETGQFTIASCLAEHGINSDSTWIKWQSEIEEIEERYKKAKEVLEEMDRQKQIAQRERIRRTSLDNLEKLVTGYTVEVVEQKVIPGGTDADGNEIPTQVLETKIKQVHVRPDKTLIMYALNNLDGENFTYKPEPYQVGNERIPEKIEVEIAGGNIPPATSEDQIKDID